MFKLWKLSGAMQVRFLCALCLLFVLSSTADAGIFKRLRAKSGGCGQFFVFPHK